MITAQSEGLEQISLMLRKAAEDTENTTGKIVRLTGEIIDDLQLESISDKTEMMTLLRISVYANRNYVKQAVRLLKDGLQCGNIVQ